MDQAQTDYEELSSLLEMTIPQLLAFLRSKRIAPHAPKYTTKMKKIDLLDAAREGLQKAQLFEAEQADKRAEKLLIGGNPVERARAEAQDMEQREGESRADWKSRTFIDRYKHPEPKTIITTNFHEQMEAATMKIGETFKKIIDAFPNAKVWEDMIILDEFVSELMTGDKRRKKFKANKRGKRHASFKR